MLALNSNFLSESVNDEESKLNSSPIKDESPILPPTHKSGNNKGAYRMELLPTEAAGKFDESSGVILNIDQVQDLRVKDASG